MFKKLYDFWSDEKGDTNTVFKLVLVITITAAVLVILLYVLHSAQVGGEQLTTTMNDTTSQLTRNLTNFTM